MSLGVTNLSDVFNQFSDKTRISVSDDFAQIFTQSKLGSRLLTFKWIIPSPALALTLEGVLIQLKAGPGLGSTFPDRSKKIIKPFSFHWFFLYFYTIIFLNY